MALTGRAERRQATKRLRAASNFGVSKRARIGRGVFVAAVSVFYLFPILWAALTSFKKNLDINSSNPVVFFQPTLDHWRTLITEWDLLLFLRNSVIVAGLSTMFAVFLGTMAAYALSRSNIKARKAIAIDILSLKMIPPIVTVVPVFVLARQLGIFNTHGLVVAVYTLFGLPFVVWVMLGFINEIPRDIDRAASVDGATTWQTFIHVILPLAGPGLAAVTLLTFIVNWNEFLVASVLLTGDNRTAPVIAALSILPRGVLWGPANAAAIATMIPVVILSIAAQRWIVRGLSLGAINK
jgi:multiple sugar transport system permease protein